MELNKKGSFLSHDQSLQRVGRFNLKANTLTEDELNEAMDSGKLAGTFSRDAGVEVI